jgi:O-antigen/teichoic acid export membrane protein
LPGAVGALAGNTVGTVLAAVAISGPRRPRLVCLPHPARYQVLRFYWSYGWPMSLWMAASLGLVYVDRVLLNMILGAETAGQYAAIADMIVRGMSMLALPVSMAVHPIIMIYWNSGQAQHATATLRAYTRMLAVALLCGITGLVVLGPWLVPHLVPVSIPTRGLIVVLAIGRRCGRAPARPEGA